MATQDSKHDNPMNKGRRQPSTGKKKKREHIGRFKLFLHKRINTCTNVCAHVMPFMCTVVTVHAICEGPSHPEVSLRTHGL